MKSVIAAILLLAAASPAAAEATDLSTITCEQMLAGTGDDAGNLLIWVDGWLAGQADETTLDEDTLKAQVEGIIGVCQENPTLSVINAAKQYVAE